MRDPRDYPTFTSIVDEDGLVAYALSLLDDGNKLRSQVAQMVALEVARVASTPKKQRGALTKSSKKRTKQPSPSSSESSDSASSPSPTKVTKPKKKKKSKKAAQAGDTSARFTDVDAAAKKKKQQVYAEGADERKRQNELPDDSPDLDAYQVAFRAFKNSDQFLDANKVERCYKHATHGNCRGAGLWCHRSHEPAA